MYNIYIYIYICIHIYPYIYIHGYQSDASRTDSSARSLLRSTVSVTPPVRSASASQMLPRNLRKNHNPSNVSSEGILLYNFGGNFLRILVRMANNLQLFCGTKNLLKISSIGISCSNFSNELKFEN